MRRHAQLAVMAAVLAAPASVVLMLGGACRNQAAPDNRWCGVKHGFGERIQYCFESVDTCDEQHAVTKDSRDILSCELLPMPWCAERDECYPSEEQCKVGAGPDDPMPACTRGWPPKPIGMPD